MCMYLYVQEIYKGK